MSSQRSRKLSKCLPPDKGSSESDGGVDGPPFPDSDLPPQLQRTIYRKLQEASGDGDLGEVDEEAFKEALREAEAAREEHKREKPLKIHGTLNNVLRAAMRPKPKN